MPATTKKYRRRRGGSKKSYKKSRRHSKKSSRRHRRGGYNDPNDPYAAYKLYLNSNKTTANQTNTESTANQTNTEPTISHYTTRKDTNTNLSGKPDDLTKWREAQAKYNKQRGSVQSTAQKNITPWEQANFYDPHNSKYAY